jgi:hypothetical protein
VAALSWALAVDQTGPLMTRIADNCSSLQSDSGWSEGNSDKPFKYAQVFGGSSPAGGAFDLEARSGTVSGIASGAIRFDQIKGGKRAVRVTALGFKISGGAMTVTGRLVRARTRWSAAAPRRALLRVAHVKFFSGPAHNPDGGSYPDSFLMAMQGNATIRPALAGAMNRVRCRHSRWAGAHAGAIRAGTRFGSVTVQMRPNGATGIGGSFSFAGDAFDTESGHVTLTPTAPARRVGKSVRFDLPAGLRTPLQCDRGFACGPAVGAQLSLAGGFVLSQNGRSATISDLSLSYAEGNGVPDATMTGMLDGVPAVIATAANGGPSYVPSDFLDRVAAALGAEELSGDLGAMETHFTETIAPQAP